MEDNNLALLSQPQPQPQQPSFPSLNLNMMPDRMIVTMALGNGLSITQELPEDVLTQVVEAWLKTHPGLLQQLAHHELNIKQEQLEVIRHINNRRND